jgi:hypothetical protein
MRLEGIIIAMKLTRITFDPDVMGGKACIRGLRVTVDKVVGADCFWTFTRGDSQTLSLPRRRRPVSSLGLRCVAWRADEPGSKASATALLSEQSLAEDWNRLDEDEAWFHLQPKQ